jgi:hypothetical protein
MQMCRFKGLGDSYDEPTNEAVRKRYVEEADWSRHGLVYLE